MRSINNNSQMPISRMSALLFFCSLLVSLTCAWVTTVTATPRRTVATTLHMEEVTCDVAIVGGGPAGLTCALYTSRANLNTVVVDKNPEAGALAITSVIANYPGVDPTISGQALLDSMRDQAVEYGTDYRRGQVFLVDIDESLDEKIVCTPELTVKARTLVLATGAMGRKPIFAGEEEYLGKGVSYCATCDGAFYQDSPVVVVGTTKEAMEEASFLTKFASTVHWITTSRIPDENLDRADQLLENTNVQRWTDTRLLSIEGDVSGVTGVQLSEFKSDNREPQHLTTEGVFIYDAGCQPITDYLSSKIDKKQDGGVEVDDEMATNVPGVYAIGDIRNTPFKQVVVAAADGCVAAMAVDRYLNDRSRIKTDWIHR